MRAIIQRVSENAKVEVDNVITGKINKGLVILLGIEEADAQEDIIWLAKKIINMRIFNDGHGKMNNSLIDENGELLVISQFTLYASTKKGNRPSFIKSAKPETANRLYNDFINHIRSNYEVKVETGVFGGDMKVSLVNDGPVTIYIDSKEKE